MTPKLITFLFAVCLLGIITGSMIWKTVMPRTVTREETAKPHSNPPVDFSDPEEKKISTAIEDALHIRPDEILPRHVKKLESVSISRVDETKIIIRWAVNDWLRWAGTGIPASLEGGAKSDLKAMLRAIASSDVYYDRVEFEGTLPLEAETGDLIEGVVIKAAFKRSAVQEYKATLGDVSIESGEFKKEMKRKKIVRPDEADVLSIAEEQWIHATLRREYR